MTVRAVMPAEPLVPVVAPVDRDGFYVKAATPNNQSIVGVDLKLRGGRAGIITDMQPEFRNMTLRDVLIRVFDGNVSTTMWGVRRHNLVDPRTTRVRVVDTTREGQTTRMKEHAIYDEIGSGLAVYENCSGLNIPAQLLQIRLAGNRGDSKWKTPRMIRVLGLHGKEIGQERGAGRAAFALSLKDSGPEGIIEVVDPFIQTIKQTRVAKRSDGTWADSFGGICVEYCKSLFINGGYIGMKNPKLDAIQLFDYANKATGRTGPEEIVIHNMHIDYSGHIALRLDSTLRRVDIRGCTGSGVIKIYKIGQDGIWRSTQKVPIAQGYSL